MRRDGSRLDTSGALKQGVWESKGQMDMSIQAFEEGMRTAQYPPCLTPSSPSILCSDVSFSLTLVLTSLFEITTCASTQSLYPNLFSTAPISSAHRI